VGDYQCTVLYIVVALVLTGMVNYSELNVGDPLAFVFHKLDLKWMSSIVAVSAVIAMECFIGFPNGSTAYMDEYES
jgi:amino acid transporter